jgi:hypothetical protein
MAGDVTVESDGTSVRVRTARGQREAVSAR